MATDFYLQIEGVKGESTDDKHKDWIECQSVKWSLTQPKSATASTGGGHTAERCELSEISLSKLVDLASPLLAQRCACGKIAGARTSDRRGRDWLLLDVEGRLVLAADVAGDCLHASGATPLSGRAQARRCRIRWSSRT